MSFALLVIIPCDYWQTVLSPTDTLEIDFGDILLWPLSMSLAQSIHWATTSQSRVDPAEVLWLNIFPSEVLNQSQHLLTLLIEGKANTPRTPPELPTDIQSSGWHNSNTHLAAHKVTWTASYQAALFPTHQHIQLFLSTYVFHRVMVRNIQQWTPLPLIICNAEWAILRAHGDLDALVIIQQGQSKINVSLDNLINNLSSGHL